MRKLLNKYPNTIIILSIVLLILFIVGKRSYNTKILPFQSITLNCVIDGKQLYPEDGGAKFAPIVKFPKVFKIKFGLFDGEFLEGGEVLIKNHFLEKKVFGYQYASESLLIEPTYIPPWLPEGEAPGRSMLFIFPIDPDNKRTQLWIAYFYPDDYDAFYRCTEIN